MNQITVICKGLENPVASVTQLLAENKIDIRDIHYQRYGNGGVIKIFTQAYDRCLVLLTAAGYTTISDDALLIRAEDRLGMLAEISRQIAELGVVIRSLTLMRMNDDNHVVVVNTNDNTKVRRHFDDQVIN